MGWSKSLVLYLSHTNSNQVTSLLWTNLFLVNLCNVSSMICCQSGVRFGNMPGLWWNSLSHRQTDLMQTPERLIFNHLEYDNFSSNVFFCLALVVSLGVLYYGTTYIDWFLVIMGDTIFCQSSLGLVGRCEGGPLETRMNQLGVLCWDVFRALSMHGRIAHLVRMFISSSDTMGLESQGMQVKTTLEVHVHTRGTGTSLIWLVKQETITKYGTFAKKSMMVMVIFIGRNSRSGQV